MQQVARRHAIFGCGAEQDRDQLVTVTEHACLLPFAGRRQRLRHLLAGQPGIGQAVQIQLRTQHRHGGTPVVANVEDLAPLLKDALALGGQPAQLIQLGAADARFELGLGVGAEHELRGGDIGGWIATRQRLVHLAHQPGDHLGIFGAHQKVHQGRVGLLRRISQHEARRARADEGGNIGDAVEPLQVALDVLGGAAGFTDMRALRQEQIDVEQRCARRREEALRDPAEAQHAEHGEHHQHPQRQPGPGEHRAGNASVTVVDRAAVGLVGVVGFVRLPVVLALQQVVTEQRHHQQCQQPAQQQRDGDDEEQREQEFTCGVLGEANTGERQDADDGRAEQRPLRLLQGLA